MPARSAPAPEVRRGNDLLMEPPAPKWIHQAAAIPLHVGKVCLVTSRSGKRWVIPKGIIDPGKTAAEIALLEAWEEAGLVGTLSAGPVGSYLYPKFGGMCHVLVFLLRVAELAEDWPEKPMRQRAQLDPSDALGRLDDPGLRDILRAHVIHE